MSYSVERRWGGLALLAFATSACALTGYDFGDYERAAVNSNPAGAAGEANTADPFSTGLPSSGAGEGGAGASQLSEGGAGAMQPTVEPACAPHSCFALGIECGPIPDGDGCGEGQVTDCGGCFWWFQECRQNRCVIPE